MSISIDDTSIVSIWSRAADVSYLLLSCTWVKSTGHWLFNGIRQPLPHSEGDRIAVSELIGELFLTAGGELQPKFRYLDAVMKWLLGDENQSISAFRQLARDTEYVEAKRILPRHLITNSDGEPTKFSGIVQRQIGEMDFPLALGDVVDLWKTDRLQVCQGVVLAGFLQTIRVAGSFADEVGHAVFGDGAEPAAEAVDLLIVHLWQAVPKVDQHLLEDVLGIVLRDVHATNDGVDIAPVNLNEFFPGLFILLVLHALNQRRSGLILVFRCQSA